MRNGILMSTETIKHYSYLFIRRIPRELGSNANENKKICDPTIQPPF